MSLKLFQFAILAAAWVQVARGGACDLITYTDLNNALLNYEAPCGELCLPNQGSCSHCDGGVTDNIINQYGTNSPRCFDNTTVGPAGCSDTCQPYTLTTQNYGPNPPQGTFCGRPADPIPGAPPGAEFFYSCRTLGTWSPTSSPIVPSVDTDDNGAKALIATGFTVMTLAFTMFLVNN